MAITNSMRRARPPALKTLTCACAALVLLGGCTKVILGGAAVVGYMSMEEEANFNAQNYAVADYMIQQAAPFINRHKDLIIAEPLGDSMHPGMSSILSKMIPERVGTRLSQLGYRVDLSQVISEADTNYLKPATVKGEKPDFALSGTYTRRHKDMDVKLRIADIRSGRVIAVYDYVLPLSHETRKMSEPKPQIIRMNDGG
ncbi:MAG: FlgO family outer membrane protein [Alphaproteobacteria bacterium]